MDSLNKSWIANGPDMSSEKAIYDIALDAEAHNNNPDDIEITMMDDLGKGFEKVVHQNLRDKADVYNFPTGSLQLALSMYTGRRRIKCGKAYSGSVSTKVGVLAGCPIAMGLLLLPIIDPVETFWNTAPTAWWLEALLKPVEQLLLVQRGGLVPRFIGTKENADARVFRRWLD